MRPRYESDVAILKREIAEHVTNKRDRKLCEESLNRLASELCISNELKKQLRWFLEVPEDPED